LSGTGLECLFRNIFTHSFSGHSTPKEKMDRRIGAFQKAMVEQGLDGASVVHRTDLFCFYGSGQDDHLFLPNEGPATLVGRKSFERGGPVASLNGRAEPENWPGYFHGPTQNPDHFVGGRSKVVMADDQPVSFPIAAKHTTGAHAKRQRIRTMSYTHVLVLGARVPRRVLHGSLWANLV
jgi:hypothetical protein